MRKILFLSLLLTFSFVFFKLSSNLIAEPDCNNPSFGEIDVCLQKIQNEISALTPAHENNKKELSDLNKQLESLKNQISAVSSQVGALEKDIESREEDLAYAQQIFNEKASNHYKFLRVYDPIIPFIASRDAAKTFKELVFRQRATDHDRLSMEELGVELAKLKEDKESLESNRKSLASVQVQVDGRAKFLGAEVTKVENYLTELSSKQQELVALKEAGFQTSIGDTPPTLEPCSGPPGSVNFCDPGFRPAFAAFSFGAPHRTGMSQYGAYGRSKSGQSAETILSAYYQGASLQKDYPVPSTIELNGYGRVPFEENYLLGIYEVPESWGENGGFEALKAQAVAARSYALSVTNNGSGSICTTESCQVYKPQLKSGKWAEAVRATRGWVMVKDGQAAKTYFASTSGGYTISQWGWNGIKDASGSWPDTAYEKVAGSPWFYKGWYKSRGGASCGKSHPWLTSAEMADILNAWQIVNHGGGDASRVSPIDTNCWGGNPYSVSELASIGGFNSVTGVSVVYSNGGSTSSLTFSTNKGSVNVSGDEFKNAFNLRAPGYLGIKSSLFNVEKL